MTHAIRRTWVLPLFVATAFPLGLTHTQKTLAQQATATFAPPAQATSPSDQSDGLQVDDTSTLRFQFERSPWRDVIKWIADECELALQYEELPTGSFSYSDPNEFTQQDAIDRVNLFLLPQGFTLVRSGKLMSVINLGDPRSMQQLDALARLVRAEELEKLSSHDVVKCLFSLGELEAADAVEELSAIKLMTTPSVFSKTNQLMITDTVAKLRNVKAILDAFQPVGLGNGTVMQSFALQFVKAEDILTVARPHLGLATGEMIGIDVSLSADLLGKNIFVTGVEERVKLIENLVTALDQPSERLSPGDGTMELRAHAVEGGNVETVYNVLQTLLAGKSLRLSVDEETDSIVALASRDIQEEIAQTVMQLQGSAAEFEVIPLKTIDPYFAISLLEGMLDLPSSYDDPDDIDPDAPKIDADPGSMSLFVRAKRNQIDQIKKIIDGLDSVGTTRASDEMRILPLSGKQAEDVLSTAAKFWREDNPIVLFPSTEKAGQEETERIVSGSSMNARLVANNPSDRESPAARYLTDNTDSQAPFIRCQLTPRGLLLQSEDTEALDLFEKHIRVISGPTNATPSPPIVFYLQYTKPDDALRLLAELLDGGESAREGEAGTLVNGYVSSTDSFLGSIVSSRDGTTTMMAGSITVVADSRLNRLIAQGTSNDIERIQDYLSIIDKDSSIASIKTYGSSQIIELVNTQASEVAATIRDAYAGRVAGGASSGGASAGGAQTRAAQSNGREAAGEKQSNENKQDEDKKASNRGAASAPAKNLEPKMTIAVHEPSNSLIVTAPEQLFQEVEQLAKMIDLRSEQVVETLRPDGGTLQAILQLGGSAPTRSTRSSPQSSGGRSSSDSSSRSSVRDFLRSRSGR